MTPELFSRIFTPDLCLPPPPAQQVDQTHSSSTVVLAIKCLLRCCIPKYETHCFSPVLFEVACVDQGYQERIKQKSAHSLWIGSVQITSEVHSDSRLRRWWTERRKRHFLLDWQYLIWAYLVYGVQKIKFVAIITSTAITHCVAQTVWSVDLCG